MDGISKCWKFFQIKVFILNAILDKDKAENI